MYQRAILFSFTFLLMVCGPKTVQSHSRKEAVTKDTVQAETAEKKYVFHIRPSLGLTFGDSNDGETRTTNLQWLGTVNSDFDYVGKKFDFSSTLFMQYGESKVKGQDAQKLQDAFILSLTPSVPVIKVPKIRLFLETTAETTLGKGEMGDSQTGFMDPLFLYQTLFLGQKHYSYQKDENTSWELTYGLEYAFQQTLNKKFELLNETSGNSSNFENGFSGILEFNINSQLTETLNFVLNAKAVALSRENLFENFDSSRRSILVRSGLFYKKVGFEYNYHQVHDLNLSENAMVDQSLMLTISF
ncbi:MAG: hypothetical protein WAO52_07135 [Prolixibacteraceae bacterium]